MYIKKKEKIMSTKRRILYLALSVLMISVLLTACSTDQQPAVEVGPGEETAPPGGGEEADSEPNVFVYADVTTYPDIDPALSYSDDTHVVANCYETLTIYNPPGSAELLGPKLATSWESDESNMVWTFHLREGVTFHDGEPFNAEAVKGALENTIEIGGGASYIWSSIDSIEAVDEYTVQFNLFYPAALDLIASSQYQAWIYSPKAYAEHGTEWFNEGNCAGTGPYTIESYDIGSRMVMTRYEDYWGGWSEGQFDKAVLEITTDPIVRQQMLEAGTADFTYEIAPDNLPALEANDDLVVYSNPSFMNVVGLMNSQKPPLDDVVVRQALSYSFPYQQVIQTVMGDRAVQSHGPVPAGMWGHSDDLFQYSYDLDKARELLATTDYPEGGFDLLFTFATGDLEQQTLGEMWKAELAKLGINLEVRGLAWEAQWALGLSDPQFAQDIYVLYWWPTYVSPSGFLYEMFRTEEETLFNLGYYSNETFDALIDEADMVAGNDREAAEELFIEAQEIVIDEAAALFIYDLKAIHIARADIKGYVDNPAYPHVVFFYELSR